MTIEVMRYIGFFRLRTKMIARKQFRVSFLSPFRESEVDLAGDVKHTPYKKFFLALFRCEDWGSFEETIAGETPGRPLLLLLGVFFLITDQEFLVNLACTVFSIIGITNTPLAYAGHVGIHMVDTNRNLQSVLLAVTTNGKELLVTTAFGIYISYVFAIWAFWNLQAHFDDGDGNRRCETLSQCTIITLNGGLRSGDAGAQLIDAEWPCEGDVCEGHTKEVLIWEFLFACIFVIIMLNVIFGIILDSFAQLREGIIETRDKIQNFCFICGFPASPNFDRVEGGFHHHIKKEHNMWNYLFFMIHLGTKEEDDYTGPESFVKSRMDENEADWIPTGKAIALQDLMEKEDAEQRHLIETIDKNLQMSEELAASLETMQREMNAGLTKLLNPDSDTAGT